jgi:transcription-repair coupling factor (superfamily II helicase)
MLDRAVRELKGERIEDEQITASVNLGVDVRIPDDYIYDINQRLRTYKRISAAASDGELDDIRAELNDRYGPVPEPVLNLLGYARVRNRATALGIASVDLDRARLALKLDERSHVDPDLLLELISTPGSNVTFTPSGILRFDLQAVPNDDVEAIEEVERRLRLLEGPV